MSQDFIDWFTSRSRLGSPDSMEIMWRKIADKLIESRPISAIEGMFLGNCILDACDAYHEREKGSANAFYSEVAASFGLRKSTGRQLSDIQREARIYQAIVDRMAMGDWDKKVNKQKPIGYKKAISKLFEEKHAILKDVQNTSEQNVQRIYRKIKLKHDEYKSMMEKEGI